ncbi:MAG TPA: PDZ domain-containing protein, partial [Candidatus Polarisedimenticolia bacterium]|nr:PDZ domain-containing protein [Candidatus Polarisedimenticolia bacterium]
ARVGLNQVENFLHSDAFFTHGNSGGPLVDVQGLVLGVNDMTYGAFKAQGYSIPSRMARWVVERIQKDGAYRRGFVGLQVRPADAESLKKFSLKRNRGLLVESVLKGTPAEGAGFHVGDLLFGINGRGATEMYLLQEAVSSVGPDAPLTFNLERAGAETTLSVKTALRPATPRIDPLKDLERYLQAEFVEDPRGGRVDLRIFNNFSIAGSYHLVDNERVLDVLPAQDWKEQPLRPEVFRALSPHSVKSLADLREALVRMYLGGRIGVALNLKAQQQRVVSVVIEENWAVIL